MKSILTVQEAARLLRVDRSTVWRWCKNGTLTSAFKIGHNWRIHRSEVEGIIGLSLAGDEIIKDPIKNAHGRAYKAE